MVHAQMYDEDDEIFRRVRTLALALPEAQEKVSHGRPAFFTPKVFCYYGGSLKVDGSWVQRPQSIMVLADLAEREALRSRPEAYVPGYLGGSGWTGLDITEETDWDEVREWVIGSYRVTAPKRLAALT